MHGFGVCPETWRAQDPLLLQVGADFFQAVLADGVQEQIALGLLTFVRGVAQDVVGTVCCQQGVVPAHGILVVAAPPVGRGRIRHGGAHGIEFAVLVAGQHVPLRIDRAGIVAAFPQGSGAAIPGIDAAHVASSQRLHHPGYLARRLRRDQQVHVVGHQDIGVDDTVLLQCGLAQVGQVTSVVGFGKEAGQAIIAALDDVPGDPGEVWTWQTGHEGCVVWTLAQRESDPPTVMSARVPDWCTPTLDIGTENHSDLFFPSFFPFFHFLSKKWLRFVL